METSKCLNLQKSLGFLDTSEADLTPSIALGLTPAKRLNLRLSKSGYETGTPRHRPIKIIVALGEFGVCEGGHG
jgi:hypothetical protein